MRREQTALITRNTFHKPLHQCLQKQYRRA
jgi:hypothetical protein